MPRNRMRSKLKTRMSMRTRIIVASSIFVLLAILFVIQFNIVDIEESNAFASGDYRTAGSGDWENVDVWEVYDGTDWEKAIEPPDETVKTILLTNNQKITITDEILVNKIEIDEGASLNIESNTVRISKFNEKGGLICNGSLSLGTAILEGNGDFIIGPKAKLYIGSDAGIDKKGLSGNVQLSGKKEFHRDAIYVFNGSIRQRTGNGIPAIMSHLIVDNSSGIDLDQQIEVLKKIELLKGTLRTGIYSLTLGTSVNNTCAIKFENGSLNGNVKSWFGPSNISEFRLPVADASQNCVLEFISANPRFGKGLLEMKYQEGVPDDSRKSPFEARQIVVAITGAGYFSAMLSNGAGEAWMQLGKINDESKNRQTITWNVIEKNDPVNDVTHNKSISNILYGPGYFNDQLVVRFFSELKTTVTLQMISQKGQIVQLSTVETQPGYNQFVFHPSNELSDGPYMVHIGNASEIHTFRANCQVAKNPVKGS